MKEATTMKRKNVLFIKKKETNYKRKWKLKKMIDRLKLKSIKTLYAATLFTKYKKKSCPNYNFSYFFTFISKLLIT